MKINFVKLAAALMMAGALLVSGCTEESRALDKIQGSAEKMVKVLDSDKPTKYSEIAKNLTKDTLSKFPKEAYEETRRVCGERFGKMLSYRFASFHRFDKEDLVVYFGNFDKEQIVNMQFVFDKEGKMMFFKFQPVKVEQPGEKKEEAAKGEAKDSQDKKGKK